MASAWLAVLVVSALTVAAQSCSVVRSGDVLQHLEDAGFPVALLGKAHVAELKDYSDFLRCEPLFRSDEAWSLSASRQLDDVYWETVVFSVFAFPTHAAAVAEIGERTSWEAHARDNPDTDIYYYLEPRSSTAFKVSRARHTLGEE
ncbi:MULTISPECIES: hypothetical protein [unclassified Devosia]|uniref:hypothetical protein n=1 Tax=unclassified Devosia TaxID=196773 RepID=UPI00086A73DA|nr:MULTISPECIES: hypothetical protein [unclassified Devosia]MBN9364952.1 hypothetical protein [Devosia sp.]ODS84894.1 MAG: hypothetical protein ABS47_18325 [Devosia sp. SCN 66-27]OJX25786.1 MAG: hypothetical protein BGO83_13345 [Devosia sp. 66-14]